MAIVDETDGNSVMARISGIRFAQAGDGPGIAIRRRPRPISSIAPIGGRHRGPQDSSDPWLDQGLKECGTMSEETRIA